MNINASKSHDGSLLFEMTKPVNRGDTMFYYKLEEEVISKLSTRYVEEFYQDIIKIVDHESIKNSIADSIVKFGLERLKEK